MPNILKKCSRNPQKYFILVTVTSRFSIISEFYCIRLKIFLRFITSSQVLKVKSKFLFTYMNNCFQQTSYLKLLKFDRIYVISSKIIINFLFLTFSIKKIPKYLTHDLVKHKISVFLVTVTSRFNKITDFYGKEFTSLIVHISLSQIPKLSQNSDSGI